MSVQSIMSGAPDKSRRDAERMIIRDRDARCRNCHRYIGEVVNRTLQVGEVFLVTTTPVRCRSCNERNVFIPVTA